MKRMHTVVVIASILLLLLSVAWQNPQDKKDIQAYVVKVVNTVEKKSPTTGWSAAITSDRLKAGYEVKTADGSLAIIKFQDDSKLIVRPKSLVNIKGQVQGKQILDRSVYMDKGSIAFNVKKAEKEQFRFSSPVSVASIRGTEGAYIVGQSSGGMLIDQDLLIILQGLADFLNLLSDKSVQVGSGQTGVADGNGNVNTHSSTPDEQQRGSSDSNNSNNQVGGQQGSGGQQGGGPQKTKHQLRIPGQDKDGNPKTVIIEWEE
ncbi:MAG TPA: FecR family protein [Bacteroidota bacterium]|nr:FecR family protein [Bacteroidota bacterium]